MDTNTKALEAARAEHHRRAEIMKLWREHGGGQHGPHVETVTMPLAKFWGFAAALSRLGEGAGVPAGWKLVPIEPTEEMLRAAGDLELQTANLNYGGSPAADDYWSAILSASPMPPAGEGKGAGLTDAERNLVETTRRKLAQGRATGPEEHMLRIIDRLAPDLPTEGGEA